MNFDFLQKLFDSLLDLVFPKFCLGCNLEGFYLCSTCQLKLPRLEKQRCLICQKPSPFGKTHLECAKTKIDGIISALPYQVPLVKKLIETFKYKFIDLSEILSKLMIEEVANQELAIYFKDFILIPVPLHQRRLTWRGFNQSQLLASHLSRNLNMNCENDLVIRNRFTRPQTELNHEQRKLNIKNAFVLTRPCSGKKLLLVDDVVTTGSTLNEIAKLLKKHKAKEVWAVTVAAD